MGKTNVKGIMKKGLVTFGLMSFVVSNNAFAANSANFSRAFAPAGSWGEVATLSYRGSDKNGVIQINKIEKKQINERTGKEEYVEGVYKKVKVGLSASNGSEWYDMGHKTLKKQQTFSKKIPGYLREKGAKIIAYAQGNDPEKCCYVSGKLYLD